MDMPKFNQYNKENTERWDSDMFRVLLVEDEPLELDVLKNYVRWSDLGIDKVYTARGGRSALACIAENNPEIVIADIQMPGISGVELAKLIRAEGYTCKIVFLTGYDNFEYAKAAVQVHAEDYILKPFQVGEIEKLIERIIMKIRLERRDKEGSRLLQGKILEQACYGMLKDYSKTARDFFQKAPEELQFFLVGLCGINSQQQRALDEEFSVIHGFLIGDVYLAILPAVFSYSNVMEQVRRNWSETDIRGIYCTESVPFTQLSEAVKLITENTDRLFFAQTGAFLPAEPKYKRQYPALPDQTALRNELVRAVTEAETKKAQKLLHTLLDQTRNSGRELCIQNACRLYLFLRDRLNRQGSNQEDTSESLVLSLSHADNFEGLKDLLAEYVQECCTAYRSGAEGDLSAWVKQYISEHYQETCAVEEMAQIVKLTPNYIRKKFKESTGQTILEYLTDVRLQTAADLLKSSRMKVKEISLRVGYENISYFTQLFSKKYGVTPNEYKKMVSR